MGRGVGSKVGVPIFSWGIAVGLFGSSMANAEEFDFKGALLGMTLTDFQALPPIEGKLLTDGKTTSCKPSRAAEDAAAGKQECFRAGDSPFSSGYTSSNYYFAKDAAGETRLYMIVIMTKRINFAEALSGLTQKWGEGKSSKTSATNGMGVEIPKESVVWLRDASEISLEAPCTDVRYMCITYSHKALSQQAAKTSEGAASKF